MEDFTYICKILGLNSAEDAEVFKQKIVDLASSVARIENPTSRVKDMALAHFYTIPYESRFSREAIIKFLGLMYLMSNAFKRAESDKTIVQDEMIYQIVQVIIKAIIRSLQNASSYLEFSHNSNTKKKADL